MKRKKLCTCGGYLEPAFDYHDDDRKPIWTCTNCREVQPRRVNERPDESWPLTASQIQAIDRLQRCQLQHGYEIKELKIHNLGTVVSVVIEAGRPNDQGTVGRLFRPRGHFMIGRGGAVRACNHSPSAKPANVRKYPEIYGWSH